MKKGIVIIYWWISSNTEKRWFTDVYSQLTFDDSQLRKEFRLKRNTLCKLLKHICVVWKECWNFFLLLTHVNVSKSEVCYFKSNEFLIFQTEVKVDEILILQNCRVFFLHLKVIAVSRPLLVFFWDTYSRIHTHTYTHTHTHKHTN